MLDPYDNNSDYEETSFCLNCGAEIGRDGVCWHCEREPLEGE